jgi:DnaJ-class molecular chaperone
MKWIEDLNTLTDEELALLRSAVDLEAQNRNQRSKVWVRCPTCNGTGKHPGGYCTCAMGNDLRAAEIGEKGSTYDIQPGSDAFSRNW